ncbi:serine/threonine protein kinase [Yoonia sp.]|uniref:serine/threonine protein kinase n=1 Tax=Yoonia sp. TaxID=2212373 RepID=UPI003A4E476C
MIAATPDGIKSALPQEHEALAQGTVLLEDQFTVLRQISSGGFGITYLAQDNYLERKVVIKECFPQVFCRRDGKRVVPRSQSYLTKHRTVVDMFIREARSIAKMRHPNIVGVHRIFEDNDTAYMALDLIEGHDLLDVINSKHDKLTPDQVKDILVKVLDAIELVHQRDLLHRDISPDNILLDKWGNPVLIDFDAAREEASRETRMLSTMLIVKDGYSPQEFYFSGGIQSPASDLYALAATFYHVISGEAPTNSQTRMADFAGKNPDPCPPLAGRFGGYEPEFLAAIDKAMHVLPQKRIQSARAWLDIIAPKTPKKVARPKPVSKELEQTLSQLVNETNDYVRNSQPIPATPAAADPKVAQGDSAQPDVRVPLLRRIWRSFVVSLRRRLFGSRV